MLEQDKEKRINRLYEIWRTVLFFGWTELVTWSDKEFDEKVEALASIVAKRKEGIAMAKLYRVKVRDTGSLQPGGASFWTTSVLYCGNDIEEARRVYHNSEPADKSGGFGNYARETLFEKLDTSDLNDDETGEMEVVNGKDI